MDAYIVQSGASYGKSAACERLNSQLREVMSKDVFMTLERIDTVCFGLQVLEASSSPLLLLLLLLSSSLRPPMVDDASLAKSESLADSALLCPSSSSSSSSVNSVFLRPRKVRSNPFSFALSAISRARSLYLTRMAREIERHESRRTIRKPTHARSRDRMLLSVTLVPWRKGSTERAAISVSV